MTMGIRASRAKWIGRGEWGPDIDVDNLIYPGIEPASIAGSPKCDSPAQSDLRAELRRSGLRLCYQSRYMGKSELFVSDADGSNPVAITGNTSSDAVYPHVSRDGKRVCFMAVHAEKISEDKAVPRFDICWMKIDGSERTLVANDAVDPCWDPDGHRIAFVKRLNREKTSDYQNFGLFVYDIDTSETEELTGGKLYHAYVPCWSPAGDWIVATVHEHNDFDHAIIAIGLRDGKFYSLGKGGISGCRPDISWDGERICWNPNDVQIGVTRFDPTCTEGLRLRSIAQAPPPKGSVYFGDWSPDGRYVAYAMNPDIGVRDKYAGALWDIFVTRAEGGSHVQLTFNHANNKQPEFFSTT